MRTEQKIFNDLIETIVNNSENNEAKITNVELWAKSWKEEMNQALTLTDVGSSLPFENSESKLCKTCNGNGVMWFNKE
jgi:predicted secreted acid phosphatase